MFAIVTRNICDPDFYFFRMCAELPDMALLGADFCTFIGFKEPLWLLQVFGFCVILAEATGHYTES